MLQALGGGGGWGGVVMVVMLKMLIMYIIGEALRLFRNIRMIFSKSRRYIQASRGSDVFLKTAINSLNEAMVGLRYVPP